MTDPRPVRRSKVGGWPIAIIGMVLVLLTYELRYTLIPFVFAGVIGFVLEPPVGWCAARMGGRRWPAAVGFTLLILALVLGGGFWVGQRSVREIAATAHNVPTMLHHGMQAVAGPGGLTLFGTHYTPQELTALILNGATNVLGAAQVFLAVRIGIGVIAAVVLTLVLVPYFLISGPRLAAGAIWLVPPERRRSVYEMLPVLVPVLRRYVAGLLCVVAYAALVAWIGLGPIFHVPGASLLAIVIGFLELIPVVGPISSLVLIGLAAASQGGFADIFLMVYALVLRLSIDNLVGPFALGRSARVHPVIVIFGFVIGAMLFGIIGLLLAVPVAATIRIILEQYYAEPIEPETYGPPVRTAPARLDNEAVRPR
jgi:predicted PurR-regulated permease PerM